MKYIFSILLLFTNTAFAQIIVDKDNTHIFFGDKIEYYEDKNNLEFQELLKQDPAWKASSLKNFNLGITRSVYWIKFDLENRTDRELHLAFNNVHLDSIKLYIINKNGSYTEKTGGIIYPFNNRDIKDKDFFFIIPPFTGTKTIYARLKSDYIVGFIPEILTVDRAAERTIREYLPHAVYYGILLALIIYNFFIFISSREKSYITISFLILSFALYDIAHDGYGYMFIWPSWPFFQRIVIPFAIGLIGIADGYLLQITLDTKKQHKKFHLLLNLLIINGATICLLSFIIDKHLILPVTIFYLLQAALSTQIPLFYLGFLKRNRSAVLLFIVFFFMSLADFFAAAGTTSFFTELMPFLNNYIELLLILKLARAWVVIMLSFIIADKINIMKKNLEISEKTYRSIFNGTNEVIAILDLSSFKVIDANDSLLKAFDMEYKDVIGKTANFFSSTEDGYTNEKALKVYQTMVIGNFQPVEWLYKKRTGEKFWAEISMSYVTINGVKRLMIVQRDIGDRKKAEEVKLKMMQQLAQAQKMEAVGSLSGGLAHDFNNILTGILGSSTLVEMQLNKDVADKEKIAGYITVIKEASLKAAATVRRLLTLTRKNDLKFASGDLNLLLKNVTDICLNSFPKSVTIQIQYSDNPAMVNADLSGIEQAFLNILVNASHALTIMKSPSEPEGGIISAKIDKQYADDIFCMSNPEAVKGKYYHSVSIQDNGCGIDREIIDRIFDPFFSTKGEADGSGLGLSMVYSIVRQHNGIIKVYSEKGRGSTFIIYLPEYTGEDTAEAPAGESVIKWHGRILLIDDDSIVRSTAHDILKECGYDVLVAGSGTEGIEIFRENAEDIDTVLLDTSMPGLSGLDTFKEIKKINPSVKIIMSSGFSMDERVHKAIDLGADSFIQKPYTNIQLSRVVYEVLTKA